jgi:hypothetical protein
MHAKQEKHVGIKCASLLTIATATVNATVNCAKEGFVFPEHALIEEDVHQGSIASTTYVFHQGIVNVLAEHASTMYA